MISEATREAGLRRLWPASRRVCPLGGATTHRHRSGGTEDHPGNREIGHRTATHTGGARRHPLGWTQTVRRCIVHARMGADSGDGVSWAVQALQALGKATERGGLPPRTRSCHLRASPDQRLQAVHIAHARSHRARPRRAALRRQGLVERGDRYFARPTREYLSCKCPSGARRDASGAAANPGVAGARPPSEEAPP